MNPASRLPALDGLRGAAVLGIVVMNVVGFALPAGAYFNPRATGPATPADLWAWAAAFVLVDGKMRALLSMAFGASLALLAGHAEARGTAFAPAHLRRMAALGAIGLAHGILLWPGDILLHYAIVGTLALPLVGQAPRDLLRIAIVLLIGQAAIQAIVLVQDAALAGAARDALAAGIGVGPPALVARDVALHRGGWSALVAANARDVAAGAPFTLAFDGLETLAYMGIGMAALSSGFLAGGWSRRAHARAAALGLGIGLPLSAALAGLAARSGFETLPTFAAATLGGMPLRPLVAVGYAAALAPALAAPGATRVRAVGQMALSNYLLATIAMTALFDGWGLAQFGRWSRLAAYATVLPVWAAMLAWSAPWLARFRHGPFEWLWRSLAAGRMLPNRRKRDIATVYQER